MARLSDKVFVTGYNVLVKPLSNEVMSSGGIIIPKTIQDKQNIIQGYVVKKGPGFLISPMNTNDSVESFLNDVSSLQAKYVPLEIEIGDLIFYEKIGEIPIMIESEQYFIIPYPTIKLFIRNK